VLPFRPEQKTLSLRRLLYFDDNFAKVSSTELPLHTLRHLRLASPTSHSYTRHTIATMFPADCLPTHYVEARTQQDLAAAAAAAKKPTHLLAQPTPQRPTMTRALSSALFSFFPSASASTSPSATPLPSPGLQSSAKMGWFAPLPKAEESDIAVSCFCCSVFGILGILC